MNVRHNVMHVTSLMTFANIKGGFNQTCKDVYFVRCIGWNKTYLDEIRQIDELLTGREQNGQGRYLRIDHLLVLTEAADIEFYKNTYQNWTGSGRRQLELPCVKGDSELATVLSEALTALLKLFERYTPAASESMQMNFLLKIWYWLDFVMKPFLSEWQPRQSYKLVYSGLLKKPEYLFLYLLTCLGIDVMILSPSGELGLDQGLLTMSVKVSLDQCSALTIPAYQKSVTERLPVSRPLAGKGISSAGQGASSAGQGTSPASGAGDRQPVPAAAAPVVVKIPTPPRAARAAGAASSPVVARSGESELDFESLAQLASSVVMIEVHQSDGQPIKTGSGIMIARDGYILTNHHVISGGTEFHIRMEDDETIYKTDEVIKYHHLLDLALLRIDRTLHPLPVYQGQKELVRGQRVVAIGSPLGLFNSVSDGIISGFREINHVGMIQFTAPISHGSSGGAVLNMKGEIIGISTAGFDNGQNINLAVGHQDIAAFVRGFTGSR